MICLSDNDLLLHLSAWNLLAEFQAFLRDTLHSSPSDVYVLDAFVARLRRGDVRWQAQYGQGAIDRALRFCDTVKQVYSLPHDRTVVTALGRVDAIDPGEAILIAVAHQHPGSLILTNELRFLAALATEAECATYHAALQNRIVHLRQIVLALLDAKGHRYLESRVKPQTKSDARIYRAFQKDAADARAALHEAIAEAERIGSGLLYSLPSV